jgi:hypothetical protein
LTPHLHRLGGREGRARVRARVTQTRRQQPPKPSSQLLLINWSTPTQFFTVAAPMFTNNQETVENLSLITPGNAGQVIGQTGYVLYASTPAWGKLAYTLWMRPFTFTENP